MSNRDNKTVSSNGDYIRVLVYSYYAAITGWELHLKYHGFVEICTGSGKDRHLYKCHQNELTSDGGPAKPDRKDALGTEKYPRHLLPNRTAEPI